jgi:hypothetical protein
MNPAAQKRIGLKADLDSYLSKLDAVDSSTLTVDGLKYLKSLEQLEGKSFTTAPLVPLGLNAGITKKAVPWRGRLLSGALDDA